MTKSSKINMTLWNILQEKLPGEIHVIQTFKKAQAEVSIKLQEICHFSLAYETYAYTN